MKFKCGCGNEYVARWNDVVGKNQWQCSECSGNAKWTIEKIKEKCREHDVECLEDKYVDNKTKMRFKCKCGNEYEAKWNSVIGRNQWQCPKCSGRAKWTIGEIKRICKEHGVECLEKEYANARTKMRFKCKCGNEYVTSWDKVTRQNQWQCSECNGKTSKGETITREFLSKLLKDENLFEEQKTFEDLVDEKLLSYDFFIPEFNILIEIQGVQHYKPIEMFGGEKQFKKQQHHDKLKREYAEQNELILIEIPWNCNGIDTEEKLIEELKNKLSGLIK